MGYENLGWAGGYGAGLAGYGGYGYGGYGYGTGRGGYGGQAPAARAGTAYGPGAAQGVPVLDLRKLDREDPGAAQVARWLQDPSYGLGGVSVDGDPNTLRYDEFLATAPALYQLTPDPQVQAALVRLEGRLVRGGDAGFANAGWSVSPTPPPRPARAGWQEALAIDLPQALPPAPGRTVAYGGFALHAARRTGSSTLAFPFPTPRAHQTVDLERLELQLVDPDGRPLPADAMSTPKRVEVGPEKALLHVTFDLSKLPESGAYLRWSVPTTVVDAPLDLSTPVPLKALDDVRDAEAAWLQPAPMIQSDHPEIQALAAKIREGATSVQEIAARTLQAITALRKEFTAADTDFQNDALAFLRTGLGECVAHGNLFAALMRANGVPCRVVSGISRGIGYALNMHYQNEYLVPGKGWVHVEPQGLELQSSRADMVHTGIVYPEQEAEGFGLDHYAGVPQLTMRPEEIDAEGRRIMGQEMALWATSGLEVNDSVHPDLGPGLHGAL